MRVNTETMQPTINPGDYILLDRAATEFTYGDIVLYHFEGDQELEPFNDIFRIVGLPGDSIAIKEDICIVNGKRNKTRFIRKKDILLDEIEEILPNGLRIKILYMKLRNENNMNSIKIQNNHYFLTGDNRSGQIDSRYFGPIPKDKIVGKIVEVRKQDNQKR
jgi:signal peptidase I